ncbi:MAG: DUF1822 family protein [Potamolinea sp.]
MDSNQSIINPELEPWTFTVRLALEAHSQAEKFRLYQSNPDKAKQIYLNTLAVYAVNFYLQCRGFETNLEQSDSWNPAMQMLMDTADLVVKDCGKLECRYVLPNAKFVGVPPEVWQERIGYLVVQLSKSLREATILGFVEQVTSSEISLTEIRSLQELPRYLNKNSSVLNLSQWFEGIFEASWQAVESLLDTQSTELAHSYRSAPPVESLLDTQSTELAHSYRSAPPIARCKLIELELGKPEQAVVMMVELTEVSEQDREIYLDVHPKQGQIYLPDNLKLMLVNEDGETLIDVPPGSENKTMPLDFEGEVGDRFSVKLVLGDVILTENFIV